VERRLIPGHSPLEPVVGFSRAVVAAGHPASTMLAVAALLDPRWRVEIEAEAVLSA
jgi:enamine deaminase RidA (YjgF/YER057c/UK114 family)